MIDKHLQNGEKSVTIKTGFGENYGKRVFCKNIFSAVAE